MPWGFFKKDGFWKCRKSENRIPYTHCSLFSRVCSLQAKGCRVTSFARNFWFHLGCYKFPVVPIMCYAHPFFWVYSGPFDRVSDAVCRCYSRAARRSLCLDPTYEEASWSSTFWHSCNMPSPPQASVIECCCCMASSLASSSSSLASSRCRAQLFARCVHP